MLKPAITWGNFPGNLGPDKSNVATEDNPSITHFQFCKIDN